VPLQPVVRRRHRRRHRPHLAGHRVGHGLGWGAASISCGVITGAAWRLPTLLELQTIVHEGKTSPAIDATTFSGGVPIDAFFWSSTPSADDPTQAWGVYFDQGNTGTAPVAVAHSVRCVYGG
jgi:hypothetical protein